MTRHLHVATATRLLSWGAQAVPCAIGRQGAIAAADKREGDGCTPLGTWPLRWVYARPDRLGALRTGLPLLWLRECDGWCDAPGDPLYNRPVTLPYAPSHERLWRDDGLYDLIVVLGHNDDPVVPGRGSAIFLHCAASDEDGTLAPTEGCVAVPRATLVDLLADCDTDSTIEIAESLTASG